MPAPVADRPGLLLVAYGSAQATAQATYARVDAQVAARFPDLPRRWAYSSAYVRRALAAAGTPVDSPTIALGRLHDEGVTHLVAQSLHVVAGGEYEDLRELVHRHTGGRQGFRAAALGLPLLAGYPDLLRLVRVLLSTLPAEVSDDDAVIFAGHGTSHPADLAYVATDGLLRDFDDRAMLATLEGYPTFDAVLAQCQDLKVPRAWLVPLLLAPGTHVTRDLAGTQPESWSSQLRAAGIAPHVVPTGLGDCPAVVEIWLDHLAAALASVVPAEKE